MRVLAVAGLVATLVVVALIGDGTSAYLRSSRSVSVGLTAGQWGSPTPTSVDARVRLHPRAIQKCSQGLRVWANVWLPHGYDEASVVQDSVRLCLGAGPCGDGLAGVGFKLVGNGDNGRLKVVFDRQAVLNLLGDAVGDSVQLAISGRLSNGEMFIGRDAIKVLQCGGKRCEVDELASDEADDAEELVPSPRATGSPTASPTATPEGSATPEPTTTATAEPEPSPVPNRLPAPSPSASTTPEVPSPPGDPEPSATATVTGDPVGTTDESIPSGSGTPEPEASASPTAGLAPSQTQEPESEASPLSQSDEGGGSLASGEGVTPSPEAPSPADGGER